ncbi:sensor histidine kinase [Nitratireductor aestuarii]|uniref:sensor histidine kinase n=1 Tax=Nitratireductor aestuarii TaxID=1735103 RepID=UPI00166628DD|nr:HAMP domain-containing sensor histidine kinase [Nitratireductor aestuarii]
MTCIKCFISEARHLTGSHNVKLAFLVLIGNSHRHRDIVEPGVRTAMFQSINKLEMPARSFLQARSSPEDELRPELNFEKFLLAIAAHDLWQPLQTIGRSLELLNLGIRNIEDVHLLQRGEDALGRIIEDLSLLIEALQPLDQSGAARPVNVADLLSQAVQDCEEMARSAGVYIRLARTSAVVESHPLLLRTILRNLTRNAVLCTGEEGQVLVGARRRGDTVRLDVIYTLQASSHPIPRPFSPFTHLGSTQEVRSGVGLFIVRQALGLLGYRSEIGSIQHRGVRFSIFAPTASVQTRPRQLMFAAEDLR